MLQSRFFPRAAGSCSSDGGCQRSMWVSENYNSQKAVHLHALRGDVYYLELDERFVTNIDIK